MSLLFVLGLWIVLGGLVHRAQKRARSMPKDRSPGSPADSDDVLGHRHDYTELPDTVPPEWVEAYRAEHGE